MQRSNLGHVVLSNCSYIHTDPSQAVEGSIQSLRYSPGCRILALQGGDKKQKGDLIIIHVPIKRIMGYHERRRIAICLSWCYPPEA